MTETSSSQNTAVPEIFVSPQVLTVQQEFFLPFDNRTVEKEWTKMPLVMFFKDTLGGGFKYFLCSPRNLGTIPILTSIFFKWVGSTTN